MIKLNFYYLQPHQSITSSLFPVPYSLAYSVYLTSILKTSGLISIFLFFGGSARILPKKGSEVIISFRKTSILLFRYPVQWRQVWTPWGPGNVTPYGDDSSREHLVAGSQTQDCHVGGRSVLLKPGTFVVSLRYFQVGASLSLSMIW